MDAAQMQQMGQPKIDPAKEAEKRAQIKEMRNEVLMKVLTHDARERLSRIKLVKPEKAEQLENMLITMAQKGSFNEPVSEIYLVQLLEKISENQGESKVKFIRKRRDSDDDW